MSWLNLGSLGGLIALAFLAWATGGFRRPVPWRTVLTAGGLILVLGAVVFFASLMAALYHLRILQPVVKLFALLFHRTMGLSGAESLAGFYYYGQKGLLGM